jgi:hypothetical protein
MSIPWPCSRSVGWFRKRRCFPALNSPGASPGATSPSPSELVAFDPIVGNRWSGSDLGSGESGCHLDPALFRSVAGTTSR